MRSRTEQKLICHLSPKKDVIDEMLQIYYSNSNCPSPEIVTGVLYFPQLRRVTDTVRSRWLLRMSSMETFYGFIMYSSHHSLQLFERLQQRLFL